MIRKENSTPNKVISQTFKVILILLTSTLLNACSSQASSDKKTQRSTHEAVEYLVFEIKEGRVEEFIAMDQKIWTEKLAEHPGFIAKEIWINEYKPTEVTAIIYWNTMEEWKAVPGEELNEIVKEFDEAFGADDYKLVQEKHQQNRWYKVLEYR